MKLSSNSFKNEESIPERYTCNEENIFPDLIIEDIPEKAKSFALIMEDPDAPSGTFVHWLIWNIPLEKTRISEGELLNCPQGKNDLGNLGYDGPCPLEGMHRYFFKLYALDAELDLESGSDKEGLANAMKGHIVGRTELVGNYERE